MAFPRVKSVSTYFDSSDGTTNHNVTLPRGILPGDLLVIIFRNASGSRTITYPEGWITLLEHAGNNYSYRHAYKIADGTESGTTITITLSSSARAVAICYCISGAAIHLPRFIHATIALETHTANRTIAPWDGSDDLWILYAGTRRTDSSYTAPGPYKGQINIATAASLSLVAHCRAAAAHTESLGNFQGPITWITTGNFNAFYAGLIVIRSDPNDRALGSPSFGAGAFAADAGAEFPVIRPGGIPSAETFGTPSVARYAEFTIETQSIGSAEVFGTASIANIQAISVSSIGSAETFGITAVAGIHNVVVPGIESAEVFGVPVVASAAKVIAESIASGETFSVPTVASTHDVFVESISSAEIFGELIVSGLSDGEVRPQSILSAEAFGTASLSFHTVVQPEGISSAETFGAISVSRHSVASAEPHSISSAEAFGPIIVDALHNIGVAPIASSEAFGTAAISITQGISPDSILSAEAFGLPRVTGAGATTLTEQDLKNIANAVWSHPNALSLRRYIGLN